MTAAATAPHPHPEPARRRHIGPVGTAVRIALGGWMAGSVLWGHVRSGVDVAAWAVGLVAFPVVTIIWHRRRAARNPERLVWLTGPLGHAATVGLFAALYLTTWYAEPVSFLSDAALLFYGGTMLIAAARGDGGCEVLALSNWVLRRDDQVGCLLFHPLDVIERR